MAKKMFLYAGYLGRFFDSIFQGQTVTQAILPA
jgi:hypothetical protein